MKLLRIAKAELLHAVTFDTTKSRGLSMARIAPDLDPSHDHLRLYFDTEKSLLFIAEEATGRLLEAVPAANVNGMQISAEDAPVFINEPTAPDGVELLRYAAPPEPDQKTQKGKK